MVLGNLFGKKKKLGKAKKAKPPVQEDFDRDIWHIKAVAIIEILGAPEEHVKKTMEFYLNKIKEEKDIKMNVIHLSKAEPKEMKINVVSAGKAKQKTEFFSQYAEVELFVKKPSRLVDFCFDYMPSSIELLEPEHLSFDVHSFSNFFNDLQARLHQVDMLVKNLVAENKLLNQKARQVIDTNIQLSLNGKDKELGTIARNTGMELEKTREFVESLVKQGLILQKNGKYSLNKKKVKFSE